MTAPCIDAANAPCPSHPPDRDDSMQAPVSGLREMLALVGRIAELHRRKQEAIATIQAACDEETAILERLDALGADPCAPPAKPGGPGSDRRGPGYRGPGAGTAEEV